MAHSIPLIRSGVVLPFLRWMQDSGRPTQDRLEAVGLGFVTPRNKEMPIPLFALFGLFRLLAKQEGPDIGVRVISASSLDDLGCFGQVILASHTPRDAFHRAQKALPHYSTHEQIFLQPVPGGQSLRSGWSMMLDDETLHLTQQYTAGLVWGLCAATGLPNAAPRSLRIRPHPIHGIDHLRPWFGAALGESAEAPLEVDLDDALLDAPLPLAAAAIAPPPADWVILKGDGSFVHSARLVLDCFPSETPSIQALADLAGMSTRSMQRALTAEGTSFRRLLDEVRRAKAMDMLVTRSGRLGTLAEELGYSEVSALSRAVRRWTGTTPGVMRRASSPAQSG